MEQKKAMTDIHMHLTPGVDDGSADLDMSMILMLRAREQGISRIFATPHSFAFDWDGAWVMQEFQKLKKKAEQLFPDMEVFFGCEVYCDACQMAQTVENLAAGRYPGMNGTNYVLIEFSTHIAAEDALGCAAALRQAGWIPIVAHMERYRNLRQDMQTVGAFRTMGCLIQINAYSLQEELDGEILDWARQLVTSGMVDFLGTDAHRTYHRSPSAASGLDWIYENCEEEYADAISFGNAQKLLINRETKAE